MDQSLITRLLDLAIAIQQIPAPTFHEEVRARFVGDQFRSAGLEDVHLDDLFNVYGRLPGAGGEALPLVVSAHTDSVFPEGTDLSITRQKDRLTGPGLGDNALGVAGLLGLVWALQAQPEALPGDLILVANVGEEGLGDLRGMRAVTDRFGEGALAYVVLEGIALGHIFNRGMAVRRYRITLRTAGGHSWVDYGRPSAVHELAHLVTRLTSLPLARQPRTSLNAGTITGGTTVNTIAASAQVELDLRSEDEGTLLSLAETVVRMARGVQSGEVEVYIELVGQRPPGELPGSHPLVAVARQSLLAQDVEPRLNVGSTDANLPLSRGLPAICIGLTTGGGAHTLEEHIDLPPLAKGMAQLLSLVQGVFEKLPA
jgi:acetylornithine deacetylase/succinyl-diaminopimelate desuccinylase-like protein